MASLQLAECAKFDFHLVQRGTRLVASRLRYGTILDVLGQHLQRRGNHFIGVAIRAGPDSRIDHALLLGLELDGHALYTSSSMVQQRHDFEPAAAAVRLCRAGAILSDSDKFLARGPLESTS